MRPVIRRVLFCLPPLAAFGALAWSDHQSFVRITYPINGSTIVGSGLIQPKEIWNPPIGFRDVASAWDDEPWHIDTGYDRKEGDGGRMLSSGRHRYRVRMRALGFRTWQDSVEFMVDAPSQRLVKYAFSEPPSVGRLATLKLTYNEPGLLLEIKPSLGACAIDPASVEPSREHGTELELRFKIPPCSMGQVYTISFTATNRAGRAVDGSIGFHASATDSDH